MSTAQPGGHALPHDLAAELVEIASTAARAGAVEAQRYQTSAVDVRLKHDKSEVSDADEAAQAAVIDAIRAARPNDGIQAEETLPSGLPEARDDQPCWVIDPIDGTRNYLRGIGDWCCSVGVMLNAQPIVGAIMDPLRDHLHADSIAGPSGNGASESPRTAPKGQRSPRWVIALPSSATDEIRSVAYYAFERCVARNFGATALHLAQVATGQLDATIFATAKLWDIAAATALIHAAGFEISSASGGAFFPRSVTLDPQHNFTGLAGAPETLRALREAAG